MRHTRVRSAIALTFLAGIALSTLALQMLLRKGNSNAIDELRPLGADSGQGGADPGKGAIAQHAPTERERAPADGQASGELEVHEDEGTSKTPEGALSIVPDENYAQLVEQLGRISHEFISRRHSIALELASSGRALHTAKRGSNDPLLTPPFRSEDILYVCIDHGESSSLVELRRADHPELFSLRDGRNDLRGQVSAIRAASSKQSAPTAIGSRVGGR